MSISASTRIKQSARAVAMLSVLLAARSATNADDRVGKVMTVSVPDRGQPVVARVDAEGTVHLLYNSAEGPQYAKSSDGGISFGAAVPVMVGRESLKVDPRLKFEGCDMALGKEGRLHVAMTSPNAWQLKVPQNQWGLYYASLQPGAKQFTPVHQLNAKPSEGFCLAADSNGNVTACWLAGKLYANLSRDNGNTFGTNLEINQAYDPCDCCTTSATYGSDGRLAVLYREETKNERDMYLVLWDQMRGLTARTRISTTLWKTNTCPMTYYAISRTSDGFAAAWPTGDDYDIYWARLDSRGNVLAPGEIPTPGRAGHRTGIILLSAPDGSTLVAWTKDKQLGWQLYNEDGQASGPTGSAISFSDSVAGAVNRDGNFILYQ